MKEAMRFLILVKGLLLLAACTAASGSGVESAGVQVLASGTIEPPAPTRTPATPALPDMGAAPELRNDTWLNVAEPVTLASQRGKVVLLEFWTFG